MQKKALRRKEKGRPAAKNKEKKNFPRRIFSAAQNQLFFGREHGKITSISAGMVFCFPGRGGTYYENGICHRKQRRQRRCLGSAHAGRFLRNQNCHGFLSAGNTTLITGTDDDKVDQVIQIIEEHSKSRKELVSIGSIGTATYSPFPVEVTVGGATIFVLPVERFEKV